MKIAIPLAAGRLSMHFGHCETFALIDVDRETSAILGRQDVVPPPHAPGILPAWLADQKVTTIIAGGMGQRAQQLFAANQITVVVGAPPETPENLVAGYLGGTLTYGVNTCDH